MRYAIETHLTSVDNLWMWARTYCELVKSSTATDEPGFLEGETVEIQPYPKTNGVGGPNNMPRAPGLKQSEVFFRVKNIMLAFLPYGHPWYESLQEQPLTVPVLKWWHDMDKKYLTNTDELTWRDQNAFQTLRWKEHVPVAVHFNELRARYKQHCHNTDDSFS